MTGGGARILLAAALTAAAVGCAPKVVRLELVSSTAEAVSFLGDTLYGLPLDPAGGPARIARLNDARERVARNPGDFRARLALTRHIRGLGRLREAISMYTEAMGIHIGDPRLYRERGEVLLQLRYLDAAIADFRKAGLLALGRSTTLEGPPPWGSDSTATVLTTTQYQTTFLLGVALYFKGEFIAAREALAEAAGAAITADDRTRAMLWLFYSARRIGDGAAAKEVLALVQPQWAENSQIPEMDLLLGFKGWMPSDSVQVRALRARNEDQAIYSYGLGFFAMMRGKEEARLWLERARGIGNWTSLAYIAAETDLGRITGVSRPRPR